MATPVEVPKLGNTVEECLIAKWRKHKGEQVSAGEVVAEIETDKATFEVTAPPTAPFSRRSSMKAPWYRCSRICLSSERRAKASMPSGLREPRLRR